MALVKILLFVGGLMFALQFVSTAVTELGWIPVIIILGGLLWLYIYSLGSDQVALAAKRKKQREDNLIYERQRKASQAAQARFDAVTRKYKK